MDANPNCAICNAPALPECPCESERLGVAVKQAENRALEEKRRIIRDWVIEHARAQILQYFNTKTAHRKAAHNQYLNSLPYYHLYQQYNGNPPLHPRQLHLLQSQLRDAQHHYKRGIDNDWRDSVQKYPEVLDYFYSLVEIRIPSDRSSSVIETPFGGMPEKRRVGRGGMSGGMIGRAPPVAPAPMRGGYTYI